LLSCVNPWLVSVLHTEFSVRQRGRKRTMIGWNLAWSCWILRRLSRTTATTTVLVYL
jgi:hypothetical protein